LDLGEQGVAFIVETFGPSSGVLVAAATANRTLPTGQWVGNEPNVEYVRAQALLYPDEESRLLKAASRHVMQGKNFWSDVGEIGHSTFLDDDGRVVMLRTKVLDGAVNDWRVDDEGEYSSNRYHPQGMRWLVCVCIYSQDFVSVDQTLSQSDEAIATSIRLRVILSFLIMGICALLSFALANIAEKHLQAIREQVNRIKDLDFSPQQVQLSVIEEVRQIQVVFESMRRTLHQLEKYVASVVIGMIRQKTKAMQSLKLNVKDKICVVLCCSISNIATISERMSNKELVQVLTEYLNIVSAVGGVLNDFEFGQCTMYWISTDETNSAGIYACEAAVKLMDKVQLLNAKLEAQGFPILHCVCGIAAGWALIGHYGTIGRIKWGCFGKAVELSQRLVVVAKTLNKSIVLHEDAREAVWGQFLCQYIATDNIGTIYEYVCRANNFGRHTDHLLSSLEYCESANTMKQMLHKLGKSTKKMLMGSKTKIPEAFSRRGIGSSSKSHSKFSLHIPPFKSKLLFQIWGRPANKRNMAPPQLETWQPTRKMSQNPNEGGVSRVNSDLNSDPSLDVDSFVDFSMDEERRRSLEQPEEQEIVSPVSCSQRPRPNRFAHADSSC